MFYRREFLETWRLARGVPLFLASVVLSACATFSGVDSVTRETASTTPVDPVVTLDTRKSAIDGESDAAKQQQMRNDLQNQIFRLSDDACNVYLRGVTQWDKGRTLFLNSISIIAGGVAPLFSSGATESLAVVSGLATAANAEISSTVFQQLSFNLVESAIIKSRKDRRADFEQFQKKPLAEYGVEAALRDAGEYHQLCALRRGLETLAAKNQFDAPSKVVLESDLEKLQANITAFRVALEGTPAVATIPAVAAIPAVPAVPAGPGTPAIAAVPAVPGTPAIPAKAMIPPLAGDARNTVDNELKRAIIEEARIKALLPYAR